MRIEHIHSIAGPTMDFLDRMASRFTVDPAAMLTEIKAIGASMNAAIEKFAADATVAFDKLNTALDNIVADEAKLAKDIQDLKDEIANGQSTLTPEAQAKLDAVLDSANKAASRTQLIADTVPDLPVPPTELPPQPPIEP